MLEITPDARIHPRALQKAPVEPLRRRHPTPKEKSHSRINKTRERFKNWQLLQQEYIKLNAGSHDIRSQLTYLRGYVSMMEEALNGDNLTLSEIDPDFVYDKFAVRLTLASATVSPQGRLEVNTDNFSEIKGCLSVEALQELATKYDVPPEIFLQIKNSSIRTEMEDPIQFSRLRRAVSVPIFLKKLAALKDPELYAFVSDTGRKSPELLREYYRKVFGLIKKDMDQLSKTTVPNFAEYLGDTPSDHLQKVIKEVGRISQRFPAELDSSLLFLNIDNIKFSDGRRLQSVTEMVNYALSRHEEMLNDKGIWHEVISDIDPSQFVYAHPESWRVVDNLLTNALKYTSSEINLALHDMGNHILLVVVDNGRGLVDTDIPRIFDIGEQGIEAIESTGIGLWMCQRMILEQGGIIGVDTEKDFGSAFYIVLPKTSGQAPAFADINLKEIAKVRAREFRNTLNRVSVSARQRQPSLV